LENFEQIKKQSYRDALRDFRNEALLSRELATIRTDVPVETSLERLQVASLDITELTSLCQELGFTSLMREFLEEAPAPAEAAAESEELTTPQAIERWLQSADRGASLALAMSVEGDEGFAGRLAGLGLADGKRLASVAVGGLANVLPALAPALSDPERRKAVHNSKLLHLLLAKQGIALAGVADDTMLYSYLLEPLAS